MLKWGNSWWTLQFLCLRRHFSGFNFKLHACFVILENKGTSTVISASLLSTLNFSSCEKDFWNLKKLSVTEAGFGRWGWAWTNKIIKYYNFLSIKSYIVLRMIQMFIFIFIKGSTLWTSCELLQTMNYVRSDYQMWMNVSVQ